ncbi:MAG: hypothetical protein ACNA8W_02840 [Bradymonadaceae bacterium]
MKIDPTLPETVRNFLEKGAKLESIRLDDRGRWTHEGSNFENPKVVALFNRSVGRTEGGTWVLEVGQFTYPIEVDDTGFFVESLDWSQSPPTVHLSDETTEPLDLKSLRYALGGRLYCTVKNGKFEARFKRDAYHGLMDRLEEEDGDVYLNVGDERVLIAEAEALEGDH